MSRVSCCFPVDFWNVKDVCQIRQTNLLHTHKRPKLQQFPKRPASCMYAAMNSVAMAGLTSFMSRPRISFVRLA